RRIAGSSGGNVVAAVAMLDDDQPRIRSAAGGRQTDTAAPGRSCACATVWRGTLTTNGGAPGVSSATPTMQNAPRNSILATVAGSVFAAVAPFIDNAMSSGRKYNLTAAPEIKSLRPSTSDIVPTRQLPPCSTTADSTLTLPTKSAVNGVAGVS